MKGTILIVEDNETDSLLLKRILLEVGYKVLHLKHGKDLMDTLNEHESEIQLLIVDWNLPYFTGIECVKLLRNSNKFQKLPIVVVTRFVDEAILEKAFQSGANDFLSKPFQSKEVECRVNNLLESHKRAEILKQRSVQLEDLYSLTIAQNEKLKESLTFNDKLASLKEQKLIEDLNYFRSETMNQAIRSASINEKMKHILEDLEELKRNIGNSGATDAHLERINNTLKIIRKFEKSEFVWEEFSELFDHILDGYFSKLKLINPELSTIDLRICAFIKMEFDYLEIANILSIDPSNFKMKRYRLKKKLNVDKQYSLRVFLTNL